MDLYFRSYRSSSAGNCLAVWTTDTSLLIDCGVKTLRDCRAIVGGHQQSHGPVHGVLVTHSHGDHLSSDGARVLREAAIPIYGHGRVVPHLRARHGLADGDDSPIRPFPGDRFDFGDFEVTAFQLPHTPNVPTFGFAIEAGHGAVRRKLVVCTDFNDDAAVRPHLAGADFVFVEANHDTDLLRRHPNPNSRYHLSNVKTGRLLCDAFGDGQAPPKLVVLAHLSEERNHERLAVEEVGRAFERQGVRVPFELDTAPRHEASRVIRIV
jgi:phosphoribosyl 1,2-cyclic phosphodiesterase